MELAVKRVPSCGLNMMRLILHSILCISATSLHAACIAMPSRAVLERRLEADEATVATMQHEYMYHGYLLKRYRQVEKSLQDTE